MVLHEKGLISSKPKKTTAGFSGSEERIWGYNVGGGVGIAVHYTLGEVPSPMIGGL